MKLMAFSIGLKEELSNKKPGELKEAAVADGRVTGGDFIISRKG